MKEEQPDLITGGVEYTGYPVIFDNYLWQNTQPSLLNNNSLSLYDGLYELKNAQDRMDYKSGIDDTLNAYVEHSDLTGPQRNTLRHRAGSALLADYLMDTDKAQLWGNLKEYGDLLYGKENDSFIDLPNNLIGRNYYLQNPNLSRLEMVDLIANDIRNNKQFDISEEDYKIPAQGLVFGLNKYVTHPIRELPSKLGKFMEQPREID